MGLVSSFSFAGSSEQEDLEVSIEFLEFLSEWETDHGEWIGPDGFIDDSFDQFYEVEQLESENGTDE